MHAHPIPQHEHVFLGAAHARNERRVRLVIALTLVMMACEIVAGTLFGSLSLLADGWHMATHAGTLTVSAAAYAFARRKARDPRYVFGTGKVGDLAGFASAVVLAGVALLIGFEACQRLWQPAAIRFAEAISVATLGLAVNVVSALLLHLDDPHSHHHDDVPCDAEHAHHDHNLRSAHLHVVADALTSVIAIAALLAGKLFGWVWMDPVGGVIGAVVIMKWSFSLLRDTGAVLLDLEPDPRLSARIRERIEDDSGDKVADLHVWRVGPGNFAAIISIVSAEPRPPAHYKGRLKGIGHLAHVTVEVQACPEC